MSLAELSSSETLEVEKWTVEVRERQKKILEVLEDLKNELTNTDQLEKGLTKLVLILKGLPNDYLDEKEVGLLLEFLISKLEASALRTGCVVIGVHHLILNSKNLPSNCAVPIFQTVFGDSTVQCFSVNDRVLLFDILEYFLSEKLDDLKQLGSVFVYGFMRAVNGERDPRCLVQVFRLFLQVVKNFELGIYCEDFFELIAAYFPLQYIPTEDQVSKETLTTLLENCLLSHNSFSYFCFSLVADRLADSSEDLNESYDVLNFLAKAASTFNPEPMRGFVDDYLTIFRRVALDPSNKSADKSVDPSISKAVTAVIKAFEKDDVMVKQIAHTMAENSEPFVLQAEMGLTAKALNLLNVVAKSHKVAADTVLPQTMYWIGNLINADTVNAPQNRKEIVIEAIQYVPDWVALALECGCEKLANDAIPGFIEGLRLAEENYGSPVYKAEYELATLVLKKSETFLPFSLDVNKLLEKLVWRAVTDLKRPEQDLRLAIQSFVTTLAVANFELLNKLLSSENRAADDTLIEIYLLAINDESSLVKFSPFVLNYLKEKNLSKEFCDSLVHVFERNKEKNDTNSSFIVTLLEIAVSDTFAKSMDSQSRAFLAETLQEIIIKFSQDKANEYCQYISRASKEAGPELFEVIYLAVLQTNSVDLLNSFYRIFGNSSPQLLKYVHFARILRGWNEDPVEVLPANVKNSMNLVKNKAHFLLRHLDSTTEMEALFEQFVMSTNPADWTLKDLFDFDHPAFDPQRNLYPVSVLWRQRVLCQTLPVYVEQFSKIPKHDQTKKSIYLSALPAILSTASKLEIDIASELMQILPILVEGLDSLKGSKNEELTLLILNGLVQLVNQTELDTIPKEDMANIISNIHFMIGEPNQSINTTLKCMEILELIGKKGKPEVLIPAFSETVKCLSKATSSKKRVVRQKAASLRNIWELKIC